MNWDLSLNSWVPLIFNDFHTWTLLNDPFFGLIPLEINKVSHLHLSQFGYLLKGIWKIWGWRGCHICYFVYARVKLDVIYRSLHWGFRDRTNRGHRKPVLLFNLTVLLKVLGRHFINEKTRRRMLEILVNKPFLQVLLIDLPVTSELILITRGALHFQIWIYSYASIS